MLSYKYEVNEIPLVTVSLTADSQNEAIKALETACIYLVKRRDTLCAAARSQSQSNMKAL